MKKMVCLFLMTLLIFIMSGCENNAKNEVFSKESNNNSEIILDKEEDAYFNTFENFEFSFKKIIEQNDNYVIRQSDDYAGDFYEIYDNDGNLLDKGFHGWRGSFDISRVENFLQLEYGFGGTNVFPKYRLYDVKKSKVSRYFDGPIAVKDALIAYITEKEEKVVLIVQDIFDVDKFYREFTGNFDKMIFMNIDDLLFSDDGTKIIIRHSSIDDKSEKAEEIFEIK